MILAIGTDVIEPKRLEALYHAHGHEKLLKVFSQKELDYSLSFKNWGERLALRFAIKEACFKAFSQAGIGEFPYHNFEYLKNTVFLLGKAKENCPPNVLIHASAAHTATTATAFIVLEQK
ncbi:MAG: 4'-phosphopantetheinyl transferase superfamily protein [Brevinema sp.]